MNDTSLMNRLLDHGVDGVITDPPDLLQQTCLCVFGGLIVLYVLFAIAAFSAAGA